MLFLSTLALAADYSSCFSLMGAARTQCEHSADIEDLKKQVEEACKQECPTSVTPAASAPKKPTGPSKTYRVLDGYGKRIEKIEQALADADQEDPEALAKIGEDIASLREEMDDVLVRIKALEEEDGQDGHHIGETAPTPVYVEGPSGPPGPQGPAGPPGRDGRDGSGLRLAFETGGFFFATSDGNTSVLGASLGATVWTPVGESPVYMGVRVKGLGSYDGVSLDDGGYSAGLALGVSVIPTLALEASASWAEFGLDNGDAGAREVFQGPAFGGRAYVILNPHQKVVVGIYAGGNAWLQGEDDGNVIGYAEVGLRFNGIRF